MKYAFLMATLVACGGSDKPADDATHAQPTATATTQATATATATGNPTSSGKAPSADMSRGIAALQGGDYPKAKSAFEAVIAADVRDADAHHYLAVTFEKMNDKTGAEREYKAALAIQPDLAEAAANLGALYVDAQKWDEALAVLKPEAQKRADSSAVQFNLALAYVGKNDQSNAKAAFEAALKSAPSDAMVLYTYGHTLGAWGQNEAAVAKLKAATSAAGNQGDLLGSIGHELLVLRAPADCVVAFDKAIAAKDGAQFRTERALCKLATKDEAGATSDLEAAVAAEPQYGLAHYWLATRRMGQKRWADAAKELEAYLKIEPNGPKAKTAKEALAVAKNGGKKK